MSRLGLILILTLAASFPARAERFVVFKFQGDKGGLARGELEDGLRKNRIRLLPVSKYAAAAAQKKVPAKHRLTPEGFKTLAPKLGLDAAVFGVVKGGWLQVRIIAKDGTEVWTNRLKLWEGHVGRKGAQKMGGTILAALKEHRRGQGKPQAPPPASPSAPPTEAPAPPSEPSAPSAPPPPPGAPIPPPPGAETTPPPSEPSAPPAEPSVAEGQRPGPRFLTLGLTGTSSWRRYNATSNIAREEAQTFETGTPYFGVQLLAAFFPFAHQQSLLRGLGISASYARGFSSANVQVGQSASVVSVSSVDQSFLTHLHGRYDFALGQGGLPMFAELLVGLGYRSFTPDANATVQIVGASRFYPSLGIGTGIRFHRFFAVDLGAYLLFGPGPGSAERLKFGDPASASGWAGELGVTGDIVGPLEYIVRIRHEHYSDTFRGSTATWLNGGSATERFTVLQWGVGTHF